MGPGFERGKTCQAPLNWDAFMRGWISKQCIESQAKFTKTLPKSNRTNPILWRKNLILHIWNLFFWNWEKWNAEVHGEIKGKSTQVRLKCQELLCWVYNQCPFIWEQEQFIFSSPYKYWLKKPTSRIMDWLNLVMPAIRTALHLNIQQLQERNSLITDYFSPGWRFFSTLSFPSPSGKLFRVFPTV